MRPDPSDTDRKHSKGSLSDQTKRKKKQLVLISILFGILLIAIATSPSSENSPHDDLDLNAATLVSLKPAAVTLAESIESDPSQAKHYVFHTELPSIPHDQILSVDLFKRVPKEHGSDDTLETEVSPPAAEEFRVGAIYGNYSETDHSALIDGEILRVGETLDSGERILRVSVEGVSLSP